jgi:ion channel-forming bestrophin family protein
VIVKHNLSPRKVLGYIWLPLLYATVVAALAVVMRRVLDTDRLAAPFAPIGTLGAAVAIFVAFRNNASYGRWWEARTLWGNLHNSSRVLARQLVAATDNAISSGSGGAPENVLAYRREMVLRLVAVVHALRIQLRGTNDWADVAPFLPPDEHAALAIAVSRPNMLLQRLGIRIKDGVRDGIVGQFDPISLEPSLSAINGIVASCERIKHTPTPRQYDYFTRMAVALFATVLPFGLLGLVPREQDWWVVVLSVVVAGVFVILERVGAVIDAPFENLATDVPMSAIANAVERDLREQLGDTDLPPAAMVVDGYLW